MKKLLLMAALSSMTMVATSCSDADSGIVETQAEAQDSVDARMTDALAQIIDNADGKYDTGGYVVYYAEDDEYFVLDDDEYTLACVINAWNEGTQSDTLTTTVSKPAKVPTGKGWVYGGSCKSRGEQMRLAIKISYKIPKGANFEIHAEYNKSTKRYNVWYRVVK